MPNATIPHKQVLSAPDTSRKTEDHSSMFALVKYMSKYNLPDYKFYLSRLGNPPPLPPPPPPYSAMLILIVFSMRLTILKRRKMNIIP